MKKKLSIAILSLAILAGVSAQASAQTINGSIGKVKRGGMTKATVLIDIPNGWHVNSNKPGSQYAIPTVVKAGAPGAKVGAVMYPRGKNRKLSFSDDTLNVYEGRTLFSFNVTVPSKFKGSVVKIPVSVRFQPCTDEVCYPPKTKEITLTAKVL